MPNGTTTGASRRPFNFFYLGRPAALYIDAMSKRRERPVTPTSTAVISAERPVAVVTGAGRGIGRLLALRLSDAGYAVALIARSQQELRETTQVIQISGGRACARFAPPVLAASLPYPGPSRRRLRGV